MKTSVLLSGALLTVPLWVTTYAQSTPQSKIGDGLPPIAFYASSSPTPPANKPSPSGTAEPEPEPEVPREAEDDSYVRKGTIYGKILRPDLPVLSKDAKFFIELRRLGEENPDYSFYKLQDATKGGQKLPMPYEVEWTIDPWIPQERLKYAISMRVYENGSLTYVAKQRVFNVDSKFQRFDLNLVPAKG